MKSILGAMLVAISAATSSGAIAQAASERFAGEASLGSQPSFPIHVELQRSGDAVAGTVSIPGGTFELVDAAGGGTIVGRFQGDGGSGALSLSIAGDDLTGAFDLAGKSGTIAARRTAEDAETFFRPPEQRLALTTGQWLEDLDRLVDVLTSEHASPFHRISRQCREIRWKGVACSLVRISISRSRSSSHWPATGQPLSGGRKKVSASFTARRAAIVPDWPARSNAPVRSSPAMLRLRAPLPPSALKRPTIVPPPAASTSSNVPPENRHRSGHRVAGSLQLDMDRKRWLRAKFARRQSARSQLRDRAAACAARSQPAWRRGCPSLVVLPSRGFRHPGGRSRGFPAEAVHAVPSVNVRCATRPGRRSDSTS